MISRVGAGWPQDGRPHRVAHGYNLQRRWGLAAKITAQDDMSELLDPQLLDDLSLQAEIKHIRRGHGLCQPDDLGVLL